MDRGPYHDITYDYGSLDLLLFNPLSVLQILYYRYLSEPQVSAPGSGVRPGPSTLAIYRCQTLVAVHFSLGVESLLSGTPKNVALVLPTV